MVAAILNLAGDQIIEQGSLWRLTLRYPGNVEGGRMKGQIRTGFAGELLKTFRFTAGMYNVQTLKTSFDMYLRSQETETLPVPPTGEFWRYDVAFILPGSTDSIRILQGTVAVSPGITDV